MNRLATALRHLPRDLLQTGFRLLPWPTEPGLRTVGKPGPQSPVILTGNYDLTVRRLLRALRGVDAWVVIAPCRGINVWCAAAGGHLTSHQVVTALKTSGIEEHVQHRRATLPQLAATGVIRKEVSQRCGWQVRFGPVYARDLPRYLEQGEKKSDDMRQVEFRLAERLEMAAAWAVPTSLVVGGGAALLRLRWSLPLVGLVFALALAVFLLFDRIPGPRRVVLASGAVVISLVAVVLAGGDVLALAGAVVAAIGLTLLLTLDFEGSTPIEGACHFDESRFRITLDLERCKGAYSCVEVCPEAVYEKRDDLRKVDLAHDERCIRCGACIVQCPFDALFFEDETGRRVEPEVIRRFKLNLLGQRVIDAGT